MSKLPAGGVDDAFFSKASEGHKKREAELLDLKFKIAQESEFAELYALQLERTERLHPLITEALTYIGETGLGAVLKSESRAQFAVFLPDASEEGKFRYQMFDRKGFYGHQTRPSLFEAAMDAISDGYILPDRLGEGAQLMKTRLFERGNLIAGVIQQINSGLMPFADIGIAIQEIDDGLESAPRIG